MLHAYNRRGDIKALCLDSLCVSRDHSNTKESFHPSYKSTNL